MLVEAGYTGVFGAGGGGQGRDWLLEVFLDADSPPVPGLGPALRALVALALSGARRPVSRSAASTQADARIRLTTAPGRAVDRDSRQAHPLG